MCVQTVQSKLASAPTVEEESDVRGIDDAVVVKIHSSICTAPCVQENSDVCTIDDAVIVVIAWASRCWGPEIDARNRID